MNNDARRAKNAYMRRWRAANREKVRAANERYWARRANREAQQTSQVKERRAGENDGKV